MIVRCQTGDRDDVLSYLGTEYGKCLYFYLDLMQFGFDSPEVSVWKEVNGGRIAAMALIYNTTAHMVSRGGGFDAGAWAGLMRRMGVKLACAEASVIRALAEKLSGRAEYGMVGHLTEIPAEVDRSGVRRAEAGDFEAIARLLHDNAFYDTKADIPTIANQMRARWARGFTRNYVIEVGGEIASHICTKAEGERLVVAGGGCTSPRHRMKGLGIRVFQVLAYDLAAEGKDIYSFYYGESATAYNWRLGLAPCCEWGRIFCEGGGAWSSLSRRF